MGGVLPTEVAVEVVKAGVAAGFRNTPAVDEDRA